jgi:7-carboxy-7-deazaguanine synthase
MKVVEIFHSIDGEGIRAGELATFVRLAGCNLRCSYCDTAYAQENWQGATMGVEEICACVDSIGCKNVTLTGGEPLLWAEAKTLIWGLSMRGYSVNVETNGSFDITDLVTLPNVIVTMDYKCPSSGVENAMRLENLGKLREQDVLKFVVKASDFPTVERVLGSYDIKAHVYLSPIFGQVEPNAIVDFMKRNMKKKGFANARVQLQLHKFIWPVDMRGV